MNKQIQPLPSNPRMKADVRLPGSKSITHRAFLMAALAEGASEIQNPLDAEDTRLTAQALQQLGVTMSWNGESIRVVPPRQRWAHSDAPILLGNSGTSMRLLLALAAAGTGTYVFDGTPRLRERPLGPLLDALDHLGVRCRCLHEPGYPPVEITSRGLQGGDVWVDASQSSQFLSSLLIASPCARHEVRVGWHEPVASYPYVAITLDMMKKAGIAYQWIQSNQIAIPAPQSYAPLQYVVEGDCSSASYFWAAAALTEGSVYTYPIWPDSPQGDCRLLDVLECMGCSVTWEREGVRVEGRGVLSPLDLDMNAMPDMVPTVAVLAAFARGRSRIRNVAHLRIKESDRLRVVALELRKLGIAVEELSDGLVIDGGSARSPRERIEAHDDHRIAMAFALAGLCIPGVVIQGAEAVAKSFPTFWEVFERLAG